MTHRVQKDNGFTLIEGLLIILVIAVVGFIGYFVWHTQQSNDKASNSSTTSSKSTTSKKSVEVKDTPASSTEKYLVISEWGVKLPLTDGITDMYYEPTGQNRMSLSTKSLTAQYDGCSTANTAPGSLMRQTVGTHDENIAQNDPYNAPVYGMKVGAHYYQYIPAQGACTTDEAGAQQQSAVSSLLNEAWMKMAAIE